MRVCLIQSFWTRADNILLASSNVSRIEVGRTSRYTHITGKTELAVYATAPICKGEELHGECRGGLAPLTISEEAEMSGLDSEMDRAAGVAQVSPAQRSPDFKASSTRVHALPIGRAMRDFSTVQSTRLKGNAIFLGPARFINVRRWTHHFTGSLTPGTVSLQHDCDPNVDLKSVDSGKYISVVVLRDIEIGQELTAY